MNIKEYVKQNNLVNDLESIFKNDGWMEDDSSLKDWKFEHVQTEGGGEGGPEHVKIVYSITSPDGIIEHWMIEISYYSHHGYEYDGWFSTFCQAEEKEITVMSWEPI